jgi:hypothetical protein
MLSSLPQSRLGNQSLPPLILELPQNPSWDLPLSLPLLMQQGEFSLSSAKASRVLISKIICHKGHRDSMSEVVLTELELQINYIYQKQAISIINLSIDQLTTNIERKFQIL